MERSGAAQGLAEVLAVLGRSHVDALLPELLAACSSPAPFVREGSLTLFRFLPHSIPSVSSRYALPPSSRTARACVLTEAQPVARREHSRCASIALRGDSMLARP